MVIVIGASGFIGSYLVDRLISEGISVLATGRNTLAKAHYESRNVPFIHLNIAERKDFEKMPERGVEAVILLAAALPANMQDYNPSEYILTNAMGTLNVAEFCRRTNVRKLISTTTYADVQNLWDENRPIKDSDERNFKYSGDHAMYVISKNCATDIIEHYSQQYGMDGVVARLPMVYGAGPHGSIYVDGNYYKSGIQTFIEKAIEGKPLEIWGDGKVARDIVYVKDVVKAFVLALKSNNARGVYNIASGVAVPLIDVAREVIDVFSSIVKKSEIVFVDKPCPAQSFVFDIEKAKKDFGYVPDFVPFRKMLLDYKREIELSRFEHLTEGRPKDESQTKAGR